MKYVLISMLLFAWNVQVSFFTIGFLYLFFIFLLSTLNNLLNIGFVTKHGLINQVFDHICIFENYVSVVSMIGYFPYINILSLKEIEYLP